MSSVERMRLRGPLFGTRGEYFGPVTLYQMGELFREYQKSLKLAEHNRSGRNPSHPGKYGKLIGDKLQAKADRLAENFPEFPKLQASIERLK